MNIIKSVRDFMQPDDGSEPADSTKTESKIGPAPKGADPSKQGKPESEPAQKSRAGVDLDKEAKPKMLIQEGAMAKAASWKCLPSKDEWCPAALSARYPELKGHIYEDNASADRILNTGWRVAGATRRGKQHAHQGTHREDASRFRSGLNHTILCVADGAGSSKWSRLGSHLAALRVTEGLGQELDGMDPALEDSPEKLTAFLKAGLTKSIQLACAALQEAAAACAGAPRDFRCTLLTVVCFHGKTREIVLSNQIGDGAICILFKDKTTQLFGSSDSGTFSGEVACFVPDDCARTKASQIDVLPSAEKIECILLCTDGVEDPFYPLQKKAGDLFAQLYGGVKEKLPDFTAQPSQPPILSQDGAGWALAEWLGFEKRGENDDRSVLLMHRFPATVSF